MQHRKGLKVVLSKRSSCTGILTCPGLEQTAVDGLSLHIYLSNLMDIASFHALNCFLVHRLRDDRFRKQVLPWNIVTFRFHIPSVKVDLRRDERPTISNPRLSKPTDSIFTFPRLSSSFDLSSQLNIGRDYLEYLEKTSRTMVSKKQSSRSRAYIVFPKSLLELQSEGKRRTSTWATLKPQEARTAGADSFSGGVSRHLAIPASSNYSVGCAHGQ